MDSEAIRTPGSARLKRDLGQEAVNLAIQGEWLRSTEVNKAILELFPDDVEAMNRLVKALIELGSYVDARAVLDRVCETAPYAATGTPLGAWRSGSTFWAATSWADPLDREATKRPMLAAYSAGSNPSGHSRSEPWPGVRREARSGPEPWPAAPSGPLLAGPRR